MSLQIDLLHPDLGYFDEGFDLTDPQTYAAARGAFGKADALPPFACRSKVFSELENEKIWTRSWVAIGLLQQIPDPGDMLPFTLGFQGVHVRRNADGSIAAWFNRHQHGGCRFVPEQCRTGKQTKCTIASCNYTRDAGVMPAGPDGEDTPEMYKFAGIDPSKLIAVRCETWGPFIFVNLDPEAGPLEDDLPEALRDLDAGELASLDLQGHEWLDFRSNWKCFGAAFAEAGATLAEAPRPGGGAVSGLSGTAARQGTFAGLERDPVELLWLFPNLLLARAEGVLLAVVMQATGMADTLCRVSVLGDARISARAGDWIAALRPVGARAEADHGDRVAWGTSSRPDTKGTLPGPETRFSRYLIDRYVIARILEAHDLRWSAPIMDARMMQRKGSR